MNIDFKFLKEQFESYIVIIFGIIVLLYYLNWISLSEYDVIIIQTLVSIALIAIARLVAKRSSVHGANIAWITTGAAIIILSVYTASELEPFKDVEGVGLTLLVATLIWAPIGAGFVVGPLMSVTSTSTST